ncbi:MAG: rhodanese-like domain-containing protein [Limisphaerales bacterium]
MNSEIKTITGADLNGRINAGEQIDLIDVRTPAEFGEVHATAATNRPLDALKPADLLAGRSGKPDESVYVICRSGARAERACREFHKAGFTEVVNVTGGTDAWVAVDLPVVRGRKAMSLERQVRIAAGTLVLGGVLLSVFSHPDWIWLSGFVGAGLIFAGITDTCGMGMLIARMPWNRR